MDPVPFEYEIVDNVMVTRNRPGTVDDGLWNRYIDELMRASVKSTFSLVEGSITITATQRKAAADALKAKNLPAVVIIDDRISRGILTAISWLGGNVKGFSWSEIDKAVSAVDTSTETRAKLTKLAKEFL
jgi:hypothetical protein